MEIVEESSRCNDVLYYKNLQLLECIQLVRRPKRKPYTIPWDGRSIVFIKGWTSGGTRHDYVLLVL